jgi:hypothetical protein
MASRPCYRRPVRFALLLAVMLAVVAPFGCTETPSYFPPCVDPSAPCMSDGGPDASDSGIADAPPEGTTADAP